MRGGDYVLMARRRAGAHPARSRGAPRVRQAVIARWERGDRQVASRTSRPLPRRAAPPRGAPGCRRTTPGGRRSLCSSNSTRSTEFAGSRLAGSPDLVTGSSSHRGTPAPRCRHRRGRGALQGWPLALGGGSVGGVLGPTMAILLRTRSVRRAHATGMSSVVAFGCRSSRSPRVTTVLGSVPRSRTAITRPSALGMCVASLVDLLRMADASRSDSAHGEALAYQAVLDVIEVRRRPRPGDDRHSSREDRRSAAAPHPQSRCSGPPPHGPRPNTGSFYGPSRDALAPRQRPMSGSSTRRCASTEPARARETALRWTASDRTSS